MRKSFAVWEVNWTSLMLQTWSRNSIWIHARHEPLTNPWYFFHDAIYMSWIFLHPCMLSNTCRYLDESKSMRLQLTHILSNLYITLSSSRKTNASSTRSTQLLQWRVIRSSVSSRTNRSKIVRGNGMCHMLTCGPHDHHHSQNLNIQWDQMKIPWDTIIQVLVCELDIEEYASQPYGVIPSV